MSLEIDMEHQLTFYNKSISSHFTFQRILSDCPGLLNFAIGAVNSVLNLPGGQVNFSGEFKVQKYCKTDCFNSL